MDGELRALERAVLRLGPRFVALVSSKKETVPGPSWERVTLVGLFGHEGCLLWQGREHYWLVPVHTIAALTELNATLLYDLTERAFVRPTSVTYYMHDFEVGWTGLTDRPSEQEQREAERTGRGNSDPYKPLGRLRGRGPDYHGLMHEEIERCRKKFIEARRANERPQDQDKARQPQEAQ